jgi:hypothetical protein
VSDPKPRPLDSIHRTAAALVKESQKSGTPISHDQAQRRVAQAVTRAENRERK